MGQLNIQRNAENNDEIWTLSGSFNEFSKMPQFKGEGTLTLNFGKVKLLNSYGIKIWCQWISEHKAVSKIVLEECPYFFVKNISIIRGFITPNIEIKSVYVPYYCEETDESDLVLFRLGTEYRLDGMIKIPEVKNSKGHSMKIDVELMSYFSFLSKKS